jgi:hypothetical protein
MARVGKREEAESSKALVLCEACPFTTFLPYTTALDENKRCERKGRKKAGMGVQTSEGMKKMCNDDDSIMYRESSRKSGFRVPPNNIDETHKCI